MEIIYVDQLLFTNFGINFLLLWSTGKFFGKCIRIRRLFLGAAVGALYSLAIFFPPITHFLNSFLIKVVISGIMLLLTFGPLGKKIFLKYMLIFYLMAFTLGGAALGIIYLSNREVLFRQGAIFYSGNSVFLGLVFGIIMLILVGRFGLSVLTKRDWQKHLQLPVCIFWGEKSIILNGLVDTGNQLKCPITKKPVIVVDYSAISSLVSDNMKIILEQGTEINDWDEVVCVLEKEDCAERFSLIPFSALGKSSGILLGFRPDRIEIQDGDQKYCVNDVIIGIYQKPLSRDNTYHALLNPEIFHSGTLLQQ